MKKTTVRPSNPLRKILIALVLLVLLPAVFYLAFEMISLNEYEQMVTGIYEQQLNVILFSVNQYVWDYIASWKTQIEEAVRGSSDPAMDVMLQNNPALWCIIITDSTFEKQSIFTRHNSQDIKSFGLDTLMNKSLVSQLKRYRAAGYEKIESVLIRGEPRTGDERMVLISMLNSGDLLFLLVDFSMFVEQVIVPKLTEIASDQLAIGVITQSSQETVFQNVPFDVPNAQQLKKLWLFPDYLVGISMEGKSIEDLTRERRDGILVVIVSLMILLVIGAWIIFKNIRNEVKLAQMKSDFVSNVSHELRTPLAVIRMYAEMLETGRVLNEQRRTEYYSIIHSESERLTRLINNILNFSRLEAGKKVFDMRTGNLNGVVEKTLEIYEYHVNNNGFSLKTELGKDLPDVILDDEAVTECLINLIDNAIKYSTDRKEIALKTWCDDHSVALSISDQGIGISETEVNRIFDKFYRVSHDLMHNTRGSGLGLTLVRHIMDAHHGDVRVESTLGSGSVFTLRFPLNETIPDRV